MSLSLGATVLSPGTASAAFTDCTLGAYGTGNACLWSQPDATGTKWPYAASAGGSGANRLGHQSRTFGNRITNRCAQFYQWNFGMAGWQSTLVAYAPPNTGNTWGSTVRVDQVSIVGVGSC